MRNLLSINSYHYLRGGSETVYFGHARLFAEHGWRTSFFSMHHDENLLCEDSEFFADCIDYEKGGGRTLANAFKIIYSREARNKLARLLDRKPADVAHVHSIYHHLSPSVLMELKARGVPTVMTAHDLKIACPNNKMLNRTGVCERCKGGRVWNVAIHKCIKNSFPASALIAAESAVHKAFGFYGRNLDRVITPSRFYRDKLIEWGWDPAKLVYVPNAIPLPDMTLSAPGQYILYFGRLVPEKGLETLIRAAARAKVPVKLAGTGPIEEYLRGVARALDAPVEFMGFQSGDALWSLVDGARAVVLPSEWYENGPMSVIEAFARGKPLVGARIGGIPELIVEGETGWLFESGNGPELASVMRKVCDAPDSQISDMSVATQAYAKLHHSYDAYYERMRSVYLDVGAAI